MQLVSELDQSYTDVIVKRWEAKLGKTAVLEATGQTFADVARERMQSEIVGAAATPEANQQSPLLPGA